MARRFYEIKALAEYASSEKFPQERGKPYAGKRAEIRHEAGSEEKNRKKICEKGGSRSECQGDTGKGA